MSIQATNVKLSIQNDQGEWEEIEGVTDVNFKGGSKMVDYDLISALARSMSSSFAIFDELKVRTKSFVQAMRELKDSYPNKSENEIRNMIMGSKRIRVSRHSPHQSTKEKQRRLNQIAKGMLKFKAA